MWSFGLRQAFAIIAAECALFAAVALACAPNWWALPVVVAAVALAAVPALCAARQANALRERERQVAALTMSTLERQARYDSLTELPNRWLLRDRLGHACDENETSAPATRRLPTSAGCRSSS